MLVVAVEVVLQLLLELVDREVELSSVLLHFTDQVTPLVLELLLHLLVVFG